MSEGKDKDKDKSKDESKVERKDESKDESKDKEKSKEAIAEEKKKQAKQRRVLQEYIVNIELTDQNNNIFYIDNINEFSTDSNILLKDFQFYTISGQKETRTRSIYINRDDYYIDNSVIKEIQNIFKNFEKIDYKIPDTITQKDYNARYPSDPSMVIRFMEKTNNFVQIPKIFVYPELIRIFKENIINFSSGAYQTDRRIAPINRTDTLNKIVAENFKYISNNKKTSDFDEDEVKDTLMFANIMYLIKNIYLKKETIILNVQREQYYVNEIQFYELPFIHMKKNDYEKPRKVYIYLKVNTTPIINIPIIKIHYIIDDLELSSLKISAPRELKPGDLDKDLAAYNTIYIFDNFKYKNENDNFTAFYTSLRNEKKLKKIQEIFLNADIVNKYRKRYNDNNKKQYTKKDTKEETEEEKKRKELIESKNVNDNIIYLLREKFNLIDNKSLIENSFIDDTYIAYDISNNANGLNVKFHSILANKKYNNYDNPKKEDEIKKILKNHIKRYEANYEFPNFFYKDKRVDERLKTYVYNIIIIFKTYKKDAKGKKPSLERRFIGDECLANAGSLDNIFSKLFYRSFGLPDKFLYDKFANISRNAISGSSENSAPNVSTTTDSKTSKDSKDGKTSKDSKTTKKGGKKYNINKNNTKTSKTTKTTKKYYTKTTKATKKYYTKNSKKYYTKKYKKYKQIKNTQ